jgi:hypothetical protein
MKFIHIDVGNDISDNDDGQCLAFMIVWNLFNVNLVSIISCLRIKPFELCVLNHFW